MKKKVIFLISGLLLFLTSGILIVINTGCTTSGPVQFVTYTDETNGFFIDYPENWHTDTPKNPPELKVSIWEREFGLNPTGFMVGKYSALGYSLEDFFEYRVNYLEKNIEDYSFISREELTINGVPAIKYTYNRTLAPTIYKLTEICIVKNNTGWIVSFNSPEKYFDNYETIINTAFSSFRLVD